MRKRRRGIRNGGTVKRTIFIFLALAAFGLGLSAQRQVPRAEYPRPQFQRDAWINLNGPWEFEFDDVNAGLDQGWAAGGHRFGRTITVPFCFESTASGIGDRTFHPWVWYRRSVTIPADWKGKRVLLNFGAVDYRAHVWVNGQLAGTHEGGNTPFTFDVTPLVKPGENVVIVRAEDPPTDRSIPRGKQYWEPESRSIFYTRTSGIWQTVWLEAAGDSYIDSVRIEPSLDGTVRFAARVSRPREGLELVATVRWKDQVVGSGSGKTSTDRVAAAVAVTEPRLWSPGAPNLYDVTLELRAGATVLDRAASYFGYRSVGIRQDRVAINGNATYLKMVLDQGYWPESELTPPSDEAIQYDIRMTKEMGFNGARKHQKVEDPRFLYWADRMGLLVSGEMANAYTFDNRYAARFTREWIEAVERDVNHPSVIIWAPLNESWGVPDLTDPLQQAHLKALYALTHSLDGTRLVIDNEGWEHTDQTDLFAIHDYARTGDLLSEKYKALTTKPGTRVPDISEPALAPGYTYNGTPFYLSEFGGIAFIPPGHKVPQLAWGYSGVEKTPDAALERLRNLYAGIARVPAFSGICYTQLTDVEQEVNGLMTYDRKLKFDAKTVAEINGLLK
jgi:beta-galactosidase/beta-glucuronidase